MARVAGVSEIWINWKKKRDTLSPFSTPPGGVQTVQWQGLDERQALRSCIMVILLQYDLAHELPLQFRLH
jgi:hypothetical protein